MYQGAGVTTRYPSPERRRTQHTGAPASAHRAGGTFTASFSGRLLRAGRSAKAFSVSPSFVPVITR